MDNFSNRIERILEAAQQGQPLAHEWKREEIGSGWAFFSERLRAKLGLSGALNLSDTQIAVEIFDKIEELPVVKESFVQGVEHSQLRAMITLGESMLDSLRSLGDPTAYQLARRLVALRYRLSLSEVGISRDEQEPLPLNIYQLASEWKSGQEHFDNKILSSEDHRLLRRLSNYRQFLPILEKDVQLREEFFNWMIRDHLDPAIFIEFPAIQEKITRSNLQMRLGRHGGRDLRLVHNQEITEVTIPIEGKPQNIVNPLKTITFKGNYSLNVADIFEIFKNKNLDVGNLEYMGEGIINWDAFKLGYWNNDLGAHITVDLSQARWWEQMPSFEILSARQVSSRYSLEEIPANSWIVIFHGTREQLNLNYDKSHAFLEIAIPKGESFAIYALGKYGTKFPSTFFETLSSFCDVMTAAVAYPDENVFYSQRQHGSFPIILTSDQGARLMEKIAGDIQAAREGHFVYQIESENCAKWVVETVENIVEDDQISQLFKIPLLETEPEGPVAHIFNLIKKLPAKIQNWTLTRAHYLLGAWKGRWVKQNDKTVWMSVSHFEFFHTATIYLPSLLVKRVHEGIVWASQAARKMMSVVVSRISKEKLIESTVAAYSHNRHIHLIAIFLARIRRSE